MHTVSSPVLGVKPRVRNAYKGSEAVLTSWSSPSDRLLSPLPASPAGEPLVSITRTSSAASLSGPAVASSASYVRRYALQAAAGRLMPGERVSWCCKRVVPGQPAGDLLPGHHHGNHGEWNGIDLLYTPAGDDGSARASYGALQRCGSTWLCPVCQAKIQQKRSDELKKACKVWQEKGGKILLVTFTLSHTIKDELDDILAALTYARERVVSGRFGKGFKSRNGISGMVRSLELTYGVNGWHPHLHVLYFLDGAPDIINFEVDLKVQWMTVLARRGEYATYQHGVDVRFSDADVAEYVAKWGKEPKWTAADEVSRSSSKMASPGGYTPLQLLSLYDDAYSLYSLSGSEAVQKSMRRWAALWIQYAVIMKGKRQLSWSKGFRDLLGLGQEKTDEQLSNEYDQKAVKVATMDIRAWYFIVANDMRGEVLGWLSAGPEYFVSRFLDILPRSWLFLSPYYDDIVAGYYE